MLFWRCEYLTSGSVGVCVEVSGCCYASKLEGNITFFFGLTWFSSNFSIFNSNYFFLACHKNFWPKKCFFFFFFFFFFCHFLQKSAFLTKFDIKNGFSDSFPFQKCILIYITVIVWKLQHSICFKKFGFTLPIKEPQGAENNSDDFEFVRN